MAASNTKLTEAQYEADLTEEMGYCSDSLVRFIYVAFPWGTGELADFEGPDEWQLDLARKIDEKLINVSEAIQIAVASGHGIGKSACVSWIILWSLSTFEDTKGVVTANTETQLRTKTWAELGKWFRLLICKHWFKMTATAVFSAQPGRDRTWRIDMVPWSENNTEAFAGLHNQGKRVLLVFDEASAIPDIIWETASGALTDKDTQIIWAVFGNPTRNSGRFKECFGRFRHRWETRQIDSRTVAITNKTELNKMVEDYGEDADYVRVRVRGVFPRAGDAQFISSELVEQATARHLEAHIDKTQPLILGVDVARFGDDQTVLLLRQGRVVRRIWRYRGEDTHQTAMRVEDCMRQWEPDAVFIDGGGPGAGVVDILRSMNKTVIEVTFGAKARDPHHYINKRVEMWDDMRQWLKTGAIPDDRELHDDLIGPEYGFAREGVLRLEKKEDMKKRGLASPDCFVAGTMVLTPFGERPIEDFKKGDWVTTPWGETKVFEVWESQAKDISTVTFNDGNQLKGKGKHKVFTWNAGWKRLDMLSNVDAIETASAWKLLLWRMQALLFMKAKNIGFSHLVDTINPAARMSRKGYCTAASGPMPSGLSPKSIMSIIRTVTGRTIPLIIWISYLARIIWLCIPKPAMIPQKARSLCVGAWKMLVKALPLGILQTKESNGTSAMVRRLGRTVSLCQPFAFDVTPNMRPTFPQDPDSALSHAPSPLGIKRIRMTLAFVSFVKSLFWRTDTQRRNVAPEHVVTVYELRGQNVYNLTLEEDNAYYANGVLVRNCGDALCVTFAEHVLQKKFKELRNPKKGPRSRSGYNPLQFGR